MNDHPKHLEPGTEVGVYRIDALIGVGGMGEVYRAHDTRLHRDVALKVLPVAADRDPDRLRRFVAEARAASALNHPHILTVHDIGDIKGTPFIAMELVEGETLRARLQRGPLPVDEALDAALQIALALSAAHDKAIVHRDVKPENVMLRPDRFVKVLDFGLAKLRPEAKDLSVALTTSGVATAGGFVGTPAYMAPEQIDGGAVDARTDVFAFGVLLLEMLTATNPFRGSGLLETIGAIGATPAPAAALLARLRPDLRSIIEKTLQRSPSQRYPSMARLIADLRKLGRDGDAISVDVAKQSFRIRGFAIGSIIAVTAAIGVIALWKRSDPRDVVPVQLTHFATAARDPTISPDSRMLAYVVQEPGSIDSQVYVQQWPDGRPLQLTRVPGRKAWPAFSPDGARVAYTVTGEEWQWDTWVVPLIGGAAPRLLLPNASELQWLKDGRVIFAEFRQGVQVAVVVSTESRGDARDVYVPPLDGMAHVSDVSPDGRWVAIGQMRTTSGYATRSPLSCFVLPFAAPSAQPRAIGDEAAGCSMFVRWSPDGRWLYYASGRAPYFQLFRQPANGGRPQQLTTGTGLAGIGVVTWFALSPDGRSVVYPSGEAQESVWLHRADGTEQQLTFEGNARSPIVSTDASRVFYIAGARFGSGRMLVRAFADSASQEVCAGLQASSLAPSPDLKWIIFDRPAGNNVSHIWVCTLDNAVPPRQITHGQAGESGPLFSPDGKIVVYTQELGDGRRRVWRVNPDGTDARAVTDPEPALDLVGVSPDSEWISVTRGAVTPREAWIYPLERSSKPKLVAKSWHFGWSLDGSTFLFSNSGMISTSWAVPNPRRVLVPDGFGETPTVAAFEAAGGRKVLTADFFVRPSPGPDSFSVVYSSVENRSNLYRLELPP